MPLLSNGKHRLRQAIAAVLLALGPLAPAAAADGGPPAPVVTERRFADWTLRCEDTTCWIYDNAPREEGQRLPYAMTIGARAQQGAPAQEGAYRVLVHMAKAPRLMRRQGIDLYVDGQKAGHLAYVRCGEPDCIFLADYSRVAIESIVGAEALVLWVPDPRLLPGAATEVSTVGLKKAFDAFRASALPGVLPR